MIWRLVALKRTCACSHARLFCASSVLPSPNPSVLPPPDPLLALLCNVLDDMRTKDQRLFEVQDELRMYMKQNARLQLQNQKILDQVRALHLQALRQVYHMKVRGLIEIFLHSAKSELVQDGVKFSGKYPFWQILAHVPKLKQCLQKSTGHLDDGELVRSLYSFVTYANGLHHPVIEEGEVLHVSTQYFEVNVYGGLLLCIAKILNIEIKFVDDDQVAAKDNDDGDMQAGAPVKAKADIDEDLQEGNLKAKIGDFGTAKEIDGPQPMDSQDMGGTLAYMDDERIHVVLEILTGKRVRFEDENDRTLNRHLIGWAEQRRSRIAEIMDEKLRAQYVAEEAEKLLNLALDCVSEHAVSRPTIKDFLSAISSEAAA